MPRALSVLPALLAASLLPGPTLAQQADEASVRAALQALYGEGCFALMPESAEVFEDPIERFDVMVPGYEGMEPQPMVVWQVLCDAGAYNLITLYLVEDAYGGLRPLSFAYPMADIVLERPDDPESPVAEVRIGGWAATGRLVNAGFDPATLTFSHYSKYRGLGDASETGTWVLTMDETVLRSFEVDGSYDGEINPVVLYPAP